MYVCTLPRSRDFTLTPYLWRIKIYCSMYAMASRWGLGGILHIFLIALVARRNMRLAVTSRYLAKKMRVLIAFRLMQKKQRNDCYQRKIWNAMMLIQWGRHFCIITHITQLRKECTRLVQLAIWKLTTGRWGFWEVFSALAGIENICSKKYVVTLSRN